MYQWFSKVQFLRKMITKLKNVEYFTDRCTA